MNVLEQVLGVMTEVGEWIPSAITAMIPIFWNAESGLTFIGVLGVAGLSFAVILLIFNIIRRFLSFR